MKNPPTLESISETLSSGRSLSLSPDSRARMREELSAYADLHTHLPQPVRSPFLFSNIFFARRSLYALGMIVLLIGVSTGTTYAAGSSLPGDTLYPVKVNIAEPIQTALIPTTKGKAVWQAILAERRLDEATALAVANKLDAQNSTYLSGQFSVQVAASLANADVLAHDGNTEDSADVKSDLEAKVTAHADIIALVANTIQNTALANASTSDSVAPIALNDIAKTVRAAQNSITNDRVLAEADRGNTQADSNHSVTKSRAVALRVMKMVTEPTTTPVLMSADSTTTVVDESISVDTAGAVSAAPSPEAENRRKLRDAEIVDILRKNLKLFTALGIVGSSTQATTTPKTATTTATGDANITTNTNNDNVNIRDGK
jgi:hypothetical protein